MPDQMCTKNEGFLDGAVLDRFGCGQLLFVTTAGSAAEIRCYEKCSNCWRAAGSFGVIPGFAGRNGVTESKQEGDGKTPAGLFRLGFAFGVRDKPATKLTYWPITPRSFWVDDPLSPAYNTWVETSGPVPVVWSGAEHLSDYPDSYAYGVVIEYNTGRIVPGKGSAVFLHCGGRPTAGCVAVKETDLLKILQWLDPAQWPAILIQSEGHE